VTVQEHYDIKLLNTKNAPWECIAIWHHSQPHISIKPTVRNLWAYEIPSTYHRDNLLDIDFDVDEIDKLLEIALCDVFIWTCTYHYLYFPPLFSLFTFPILLLFVFPFFPLLWASSSRNKNWLIDWRRWHKWLTFDTEVNYYVITCFPDFELCWPSSDLDTQSWTYRGEKISKFDVNKEKMIIFFNWQLWDDKIRRTD
jgi:hypothetical protein